MTFWLNTQICVEPSERRQQRWWDQRNICCFSKPRVVKHVGFPGFCDTDFWLPRGRYGTIQYDSSLCNAHKGHGSNREKESSCESGDCVIFRVGLLRFDRTPYLSSFRNHSASISDRRRNIACNGRFRNVETRTNRCSFSKRRRHRHCAFGISPYIGSGSITTVILLVSRAENLLQTFVVPASIFVGVLFAYLAMTFSTGLFKRFGNHGLQVVTALMAIIVLAIAVQFILDGITGAISQFGSGL